MPRQANVDKGEILDKAMALFWRKGYQNTSYDDLVTETGSTRYALYAEFGDKHALFQRALEHYQNTATSALLYELERPEAGLEDVRAVFGKLLAAYRNERTAGLGCLVCNTALERSHDSSVAPKIQAQLERYQNAFLGALINAKEGGANLDPVPLADYFTGLIQAGAALDRMEADVTLTENLFAEALSKLD